MHSAICMYVLNFKHDTISRLGTIPNFILGIPYRGSLSSVSGRPFLPILSLDSPCFTTTVQRLPYSRTKNRTSWPATGVMIAKLGVLVSSMGKRCFLAKLISPNRNMASAMKSSTSLLATCWPGQYVDSPPKGRKFGLFRSFCL